MRSAMPRNTWASGEMWLANARPPRPWDARDRILLSGNQSAFNFRKVACRWTAVGRPGPTVQPMPGSAPGQRQKQPAFSGGFGRAVRGWGPSVGHGYKDDKGQGIVTPPYRPPMLHAVRTGRVRSDQRDGRADHDDTIFAV